MLLAPLFAVVHAFASFICVAISFAWDETYPRPTGPLVVLMNVARAVLLFPTVPVLTLLRKWFTVTDHTFWSALLLNSALWGLAVFGLIILLPRYRRGVIPDAS